VGIPSETSTHSIDFHRLIKGVETLLGLDLSQISAHYDQHPEDKLCDLPHPGGKGLAAC
jgi:hypothetical protein